MKKLNRKGFTLVELLAVIIILAIVVGITIPAVLTTTSKAKERAFQTAADSAADWFDRQYQVYTTVGVGSDIAKLDTNFTTACGSNAGTCTSTDGANITASAAPSVISAAGLKTTNVTSMNVKINKNTGRSCVTLVAAEKGDYEGAGKDGSNTIQSSGC